MLDRRSQSPMATSQKMGTARAIFDAGQELEPTKRLTRSIRNTSTDPLQGDQKSFQYQTGFQASQDMNSQNSRLNTQENFDYRKPETDNFRTVQTYKPQEVSAAPQTQFNYQSFEYKKPDAGRTGSYISAAYNTTTYQEPISSQIKSSYEPPKYESVYQKYETNAFDKYKTTYDQPKTYEKYEPYKFEPTKFDTQAPLSYKPVTQVNQIQTTSTYVQPNMSVIQSQYQTFNENRLTLDTQLNRPSNLETLDYQKNTITKKIEEPIRVSEIQAKNQIPQQEYISTTKLQYGPSLHEESVKKEQTYRPTTPVYTQQQQSVVQQPDYIKQDPLESYKPSFKVELPKRYVDEIVIVENEANEHEFNAGCMIF